MNSNQYLKSLVSELTLLSNETEWVEFKVNPELFISFLYKCGAPHSITIIAI